MTDGASSRSERPQLAPTAEHPITLTPTGGRVVVRAGAAVIADTHAALTLQESDYPAVQYIPLSDVDQGKLVRSAHTTYCPYKGEAGYYGLVVDEDVIADAVWEYQQPYPAVGAIAGHVAFYPDRADIVVSR
ncbi:MAG TPA: DUF427 domain-containing protein [Mycobacterium sp.]|nr:DUF427 domain-containing protein [Mycobacterium sp.]